MSNIKSSIFRKALRNILQKDPDTVALVEQFRTKLAVDFSVQDQNKKIIWGTDTEYVKEFELSENGEAYGAIRSNSDDATEIKALIEVLVRKDLEKKKIGSEVLGLYREINMIYDLSEQISEKIDATSIAKIALKEASQIIDASHGLFLMHDPDEDNVVEMSSFGEYPDREANINRQSKILKELIIRGISSIVPAENSNLSSTKIIVGYDALIGDFQVGAFYEMISGEGLYSDDETPPSVDYKYTEDQTNLRVSVGLNI